MRCDQGRDLCHTNKTIIISLDSKRIKAEGMLEVVCDGKERKEKKIGKGGLIRSSSDCLPFVRRVFGTCTSENRNL